MSEKGYTTTEATVRAFIEAGLRLDGREDIQATTPLMSIAFMDGGRHLAGVEFLAAFEGVFNVFVPNRYATTIVKRIDDGRGTVADIAAELDKWQNPKPRKRRPKFERGQMCLGF